LDLGNIREYLIKIEGVFIEEEFEVLPFFLEVGIVGISTESFGEEVLKGFD